MGCPSRADTPRERRPPQAPSVSEGEAESKARAKMAREGASLKQALREIRHFPFRAGSFVPIFGNFSRSSAAVGGSPLPDTSATANSPANGPLFERRGEPLRTISGPKEPVQTLLRRILRRSQFRLTPSLR
jgi:hypothetical protein